MVSVRSHSSSQLSSYGLDDPAEVFDSVAHTGQLPPEAASSLDVVAYPGGQLQELRAGDIIVRRALGEGRLAHVATVVSGRMAPAESMYGEGIATEDPALGQYAQVDELSPWGRPAHHRFARRIVTADGRLPEDQVVLRRRDLDEGRGFREHVPPTMRAPASFAEFAPEATSTDFTCSTSSTVSLHTDVVTAMVDAWNNSGDGQTVSGLCNDTPSVCPTAHQAPHGTGDAAHFVSLSQFGIRVIELAALWGENLTTITRQSRRAAVDVKTRPTAAPAQALSVVGIRSGTTRHLHIARETPRRVESHVGNERWTNLGVEATPGTDYRVFKRRYFEASTHRQWGREAVVQWLVGLANFYRDRTGELLGVGDISHIVGEVMTDHGSHRLGRDVDIYGLEAPPAGSTFPRSHWASASGTTIEYKELTAPAAGDASPRYGVPGTRVAVLAGTRATRVQQLWVTLLAYCAGTQTLLNRVVWHGANRLRTQAVTEAQAAWDATQTANAGTTAMPGWRPSWGPGPANRAAISAPAHKFVGDGSPTRTYGAGAAWPLHQDHIHVRFT